MTLLEPNAWKLARSVLRGEGGSDAPALPDRLSIAREISVILTFE